MCRKSFFLVIISALLLLPPAANACTSMLVSAKASATGRPMLWKHRDTGTEDNFLERVEPRDGGYGYVALFNAGDSLLAEAWMGMNDAGFAIMNTVSYNIAPDTAKFVDQEGIIMSKALARCRTVDDFALMLDTLPKPLGVSTNFGVMDACGNLAYFETDDRTARRVDVDDAGCLIRTNYSMAGAPDQGMGYIRYQNVCDILADEISGKCLSPLSFTEKVSRSFWHSLLGRDMAEDDVRWVIDQDFVPRYSSSASIVVEGVNPGEDVSDMCMYALLGYPPCSELHIVGLHSVPDALRPTAPGWHSPYCDTVVERKHKVFPIDRGSGHHYIDMDYLRPVMRECHEKSLRTAGSLGF